MICELCKEPILDGDRYLLCDVGPVHQKCGIKAVNAEVSRRTASKSLSDTESAITDLRRRVAQLEDMAYRPKR